MTGGRPTTARGVPPPAAGFDANSRVTFSKPAHQQEPALFKQPLSASRLTDSGFNSASFSNYSYSDSYDDTDGEGDYEYRPPGVGSSADTHVKNYPYTGRRGYGYQPQPSIRASYESSGYGSREGGVYDSREGSSVYDSRDRGVYDSRDRGVYDSRDRGSYYSQESDAYYSSRDGGGVHYERRGAGDVYDSRDRGGVYESRDGGVYDSRDQSVYSSYDSQDQSNYTPYSSRDQGVYDSRDSRPHHCKDSRDYSTNRDSADHNGYGRYSRSGPFYSSVDEGTPAASYDYSSYRGSADYRRSSQRVRSSLAPSSLASRQAAGALPRNRWQQSSMQRSGATARTSYVSTAATDGVPPPKPGFRRAWEKTRDEFYEAAREVCVNEDGKDEKVPEWLRRALERKEEETKAENKKLRSSEAKWARRLDATEKQLAEEQRRLRAIAQERQELEKQRARLELHHRARDLVPATTYETEPPPRTFPITDENRELMHGLCKKRYEANWDARQHQKRAAAMEQAEAQARAEKDAYSYDPEFYYLDKGPRQDTALLATPTWEDVKQLKERRHRLKASKLVPQGRTIVIR